MDISTISRVSNVKYAQTKWGIFPLKFFFGDSYVTENGEEMATRKIKLALQELINKEDKKKPLSDEALAKRSKRKVFLLHDARLPNTESSSAFRLHDSGNKEDTLEL